MNDNAATYPLRSSRKLRPLLQLAAGATAISLWRGKVMRVECAAIEDVQLDVDEECGPLPARVGDIVHQHVDRSGEALADWVARFEQILGDGWKAVLDNPVVYLRVHFDNLAWHDDMSIDKYTTVKRILAQDTLSPLEKFNLASTYCMREEVRSIWPTLDGTLRMAEFAPNSFRRYWQYCMNNEAASMSELRSMGCSTVNRGKIDNQWALEFVLYHLTDEGRVEQAVSLVSNFESGSSQVVDLLAILKDEDLRAFLKAIPSHVIVSLMQEKKWELVVQTWKYMCSELDVADLAEALYVLMKDTLISLSSVNLNRICTEDFTSKDFDAVMYEMWRSSTAEFKDHVRRNYALKYIEKLQKLTLKRGFEDGLQIGRDARMMIDIFEGNDLKTNMRYWRRCWSRFYNIKPLDLEKIMKLCFADDDEIAKFKRNEMMKRGNGEFVGWYLMNSEWYGCQFGTFFRYCYEDKDAVKELLTEMLYSTKYVSRFVHDNQIHFDFLEDFFAGNDVFEFGLEFMELDSTRVCLCDLVNCRRFSVISDTVDEFVQDTLFHRKSLVQYMMVYGVDNIIDGIKSSKSNRVTEVLRFLDFIEWCSDEDEPELANLEEILSVDDVFELFIDKVLPTLEDDEDDDMFGGDSDDSDDGNEEINDDNKTEDDLLVMDLCLLWFLGSKEEVKRFKVSKLQDNMHRFRSIARVFNPTTCPSSISFMMSFSYHAIVDRALDWVFDGNKAEIDEFMKKLEPFEKTKKRVKKVKRKV